MTNYLNLSNFSRKIQSFLSIEKKLYFSKFESPLVSIIIPAHNNWQFSYNCIQSILKNTEDVPYEIIFADDASNDKTKKIEKFIKNIRVIRSQKNLGFLLNCNNAAQHARGKYLVFLNNDVTVTPKWLSMLVDLAENDEKIGIIGSKLIYPNGVLQDAGGIVWENGSAHNFGRGKDPNSFEYNYIREVDYITGASLLIKKSLWKDIGGFDTRFIPAYYEDTDIAFEARKRGYKVMYQPQSVVIHYEGASHGTSVDQGIKKFQIINQRKFQKKWNKILKREHRSLNSNLWIASNRNRNRRKLLMIDVSLPIFDIHAGSRSVYHYIQAIKNMDIDITFLAGKCFDKLEPYTSILQQQNIEVVYGINESWEKWFEENGEHFDYVFINKPEMAAKFIPIIRKISKAKILFYGHDLHHVRETLRYKLTKDENILQSIEYWKNIEMQAISSADVVYYPSFSETETVNVMFPDVNAKTIPLFAYNDDDNFKDTSWEEKKDVMFVGGFAHLPNEDGVLWFLQDIWPQVLKKKKDIVFHIIGNDIPKSVRNFASDNVQIHEKLNDYELEKFYTTCRIAVVPLRFGAGVKGKLVEALHYGIPTITTNVGAEGIKNIDSIIPIHDNADDFAKELVSMYENNELLSAMNHKEINFCKEHFSLKNAQRILEEDLVK